MARQSSFSYHVLDSWEDVKELLGRTKSWAKKFNLLLGYTNALNEFDVCMHDHERDWGGEEFVKELAKRWKAVLKNPIRVGY